MIKMAASPKLICSFNEILIKISATFFVDVNKLILQFIWKGTDSKIAYKKKRKEKKRKLPRKRKKWEELLYLI